VTACCALPVWLLATTGHGLETAAAGLGSGSAAAGVKETNPEDPGTVLGLYLGWVHSSLPQQMDIADDTPATVDSVVAAAANGLSEGGSMVPGAAAGLCRIYEGWCHSMMLLLLNPIQ